MTKTVTKDMTEGKPLSLLLRFFFPLLFGMLFQQFYNLVDMAIVGQTLGSQSLAAVGSTGSINFMVLGFCMGVCNGFSIPVAQRFGAKDYKGMRQFVTNAIWLSIIFASLMTLLVCIFCKSILIMMNTPKDIFQGAHSYLFVIFLGIPVTYLYNLTSGIMRAMGDSKNPLIFLIISSVLNIIFDLVAIRVLDMGVAGAAWATVLAQLISGLACLFFMKKNYALLRFEQGEWALNKKCVKFLCRNGLPMGLQYSITAVGALVLQRAVNGLGSLAVAAISTGNRISMFFCCPFDAMGSTMATYTGQNLGAKKLDRVDKGIFASSGICLVYSLVAAAILILFGSYFALLFVQPSERHLIDRIQELLTWTSAFYFPLALVNIVRFTIQGLGFSFLAVVAGICEMVARAVVGAVFVPGFGFTAACLAGPVAWILADAFLIPAYFYCIRQLKTKIMRKDLTQ
ncbi:MAG: MATE family efflux transporter [Eubacterium sp.]|nr:MATE family efflux transporter [Eubacterium sp.]